MKRRLGKLRSSSSFILTFILDHAQIKNIFFPPPRKKDFFHDRSFAGKFMCINLIRVHSRHRQNTRIQWDCKLLFSSISYKCDVKHEAYIIAWMYLNFFMIFHVKSVRLCMHTIVFFSLLLGLICENEKKKINSEFFPQQHSLRDLIFERYCLSFFSNMKISRFSGKCQVGSLS
jgi:hypothetical protein